MYEMMKRVLKKACFFFLKAKFVLQHYFSLLPKAVLRVRLFI